MQYRNSRPSNSSLIKVSLSTLSFTVISTTRNIPGCAVPHELLSILISFRSYRTVRTPHCPVSAADVDIGEHTPRYLSSRLYLHETRGILEDVTVHYARPAPEVKWKGSCRVETTIHERTYGCLQCLCNYSRGARGSSQRECIQASSR